MDSLTDLFKKEKLNQLILVVLFIIYLIMGYRTPEPIAKMVDSIPGKIVLLISSLSLLYYANPILGVLGLFVAFHLMRSSSVATGTYGIAHYMPSENKKMSQFTAFNQFPYTLEQEIVKKMTPVHKSSYMDSQATFKPILDNTHDASPL
jgi:hypothetical protein